MTTPYYSDDLVDLYHGDCLREPAWQDADVLLTDPPYGMAYVSGHRRTREPIAGDQSSHLRDAVVLMWLAGRTPVRPGVVFGTWRVAPPGGERQRLVWHKRGNGPGMGNLRMPWGTSHEDIHVMGDGWDVSKTGVKRAGSVLVTDVQMGGRYGEVARAGHPTAKPVELLARLLAVCPPGVVADPFAGAGATLLAARQLGRRAIGVELEERYCEIAARRLAEAAS